MSINEIIKKYLPITNQKFSKTTTKINHCQNKNYQYCCECKEKKLQLCNEKLIFREIKQVSNFRWHLSFNCQNNHLIIRYVIIENKKIIIGAIKN
ncbi:MAG: hypothetical protein REH79_02255 [Spiroplasma sp.]|nr:hypothetical protein [Spiroplasma sp.]